MRQDVAPPPPPPPPAAPAPVAPSVTVPPGVVVNAGGTQIRVLSQREVSDLRVRRSELSDQLVSAANRRNELAEELKNADPAARQGLQERIGVLDQRIVQLETDIAETGRILTSTPWQRNLESRTEVRGGGGGGGFRMDEDVVGGLGAVFTIFVLFPIALAHARRVWKRTSNPPPTTSREQEERFIRLEQAVDAVALEVERLGEGQRFVTRLLTEGSASPLSAAQQRTAAEAMRMSSRD